MPLGRTHKEPITANQSNEILQKLSNTLQLKSKSSLGSFRLFDQDKDGLIRKEDFANHLTGMNICDKEDAKQLFDSLAQNDKKFLSFDDFHKGIEFKDTPLDYTRPKAFMRSSQSYKANPFLSTTIPNIETNALFRTGIKFFLI